MNLRNSTSTKNAFGKRIIISIEIFLLLILLPACRQQLEQKTVIALIYDVSGSTFSVRELYFKQTREILEQMPSNSEICINKITDASIQTSDWKIFEYKTKELKTFLDYVGYMYSRNEDREMKEKNVFIDSVLRQIKSIASQDSCGKTDIISALYIAGKSLENRNAFKYLFIFTDGLENAKIFNRRKMKMNLEGVNVYFIGPGRNEARRFFELKNFWTSFIEESGGKVRNFGPELFSNPKEIFKSKQK